MSLVIQYIGQIFYDIPAWHLSGAVRLIIRVHNYANTRMFQSFLKGMLLTALFDPTVS